MQAAEFAYLLNARPQIQVVSVSEKNLDAQFLEHVLRDAFHSSLGTNRHEYGGFDSAVRRGQMPASRTTSGCLDFKPQRHSGSDSKGTRTFNRACLSTWKSGHLWPRESKAGDEASFSLAG